MNSFPAFLFWFTGVALLLGRLITTGDALYLVSLLMFSAGGVVYWVASMRQWAHLEFTHAEQLEHEGGLADPFETALDAVIEELLTYNGEPVVKGEHSLHRKVCELEKLCEPNSHLSKNQPWTLYRPARTHWFQLLKASRGTRCPDVDGYQVRPNPEQARRFANRLLVELVNWKTDSWYLESLKGERDGKTDADTAR